MNNSSNSESRDYERFDELAEEFAERHRRNERPSLQEYVDRLPQMADEIREMFPALVEVERAEVDARDPAKPPDPPVATRLREIGDYRIVREIGRGGMGVVYEAEQISLGRRVALKVLPAHVVGDRKTKERFLREAKSAARLHHTNIVPVFEVGHDRDVSFYAMQLIQGQGLDQVIQELRRLRQHSLGGQAGNAAMLKDPDLAATRTQARLTAASQVRKRELGQMAELLVTGQFAAETKQLPMGDAAAENGADVTEQIDSAATSERAASNLSAWQTPAPSPTDSQTSAVLPGGKHVSEVDTSGRRVPFFRSVAQIGRQVAQGLAHAHLRGIIHRDVKPSNLLLDTAGVVWITDFGLAKADDDGLTATGDILGTLRYMAPERFRGVSDARADIYGLGMTLYEMLTLRPAFASSDRLKLIEQLKGQEPPAPRSIDARIPRDLETIVLKAIDKDLDRRYSSMDAMAEDLRRFLVDEPIRARQVSATERYWRWARRNPVVAVLGGVLTAVLVLATIASLTAAGRFASLADRERRSAGAERAARQSAQRAALETAKIAAQSEADKEFAQRDSYRSTIKLAESMLQGDAKARYQVADILWSVQPELRGWEWGHLMAQCPLEDWSLQTNQGGITQIACSDDGRSLATAGNDGTVALWDSWTRAEMWRRNVGRAVTLAIEPHSRYVAVGSDDDDAPAFRILDGATGQSVYEAAEKGRGRVAFGPDGKDAYVLRPDRLDRVSTEGWSVVASVPKPKPEWWTALRLFVDGAGRYVGVHAVTGDESDEHVVDRRMALFDGRTLQPVTQFDATFPTRASRVQSVVTPVLHSGFDELIYSDGPSLFSQSLVMEPSLQRRYARLVQHPTILNYLAYDPRSKSVIAASKDGMVSLRDADGEIQHLYHGLPICGLAMFPDGRFITAGLNGLLKCWQPGRSAALALNVDASPSSASDGILAFADGGRKLLYRTWDLRFHFLYDTSTLAYRQYPTPTADEYGRLFPLIHPGTNDLVVDSKNGLTFYPQGSDAAKVTKPRTIGFARPFSAAFDASGRVLVVSGQGQQVAAFDLNTNRQFPAPDARDVGCVSVNPTGTQAAFWTGTSLKVWDVATGRVLNKIDWEDPWFGPPDEKGARLTPDGTGYVVVVGAQFHPSMNILALIKESEHASSLVLWDTDRGRVRGTIDGQSGIRFTSCAFSPDGNRVLVACSDSKVRIYDWRIAKELLALSDAAWTVHVAASPDGVTLAYSGWAPSPRIAKALPWNEGTHRDGDFYRTLDDLWWYSIQLSPRVKPHAESSKVTQAARADEAEILGDIERRRGAEAGKPSVHYSKSIDERRNSIANDPTNALLLHRLANTQEKWLDVETTQGAERGAAALQRVAEFWRKLVADGNPQQAAWRYCLDFQRKHIDLQLAQGSNAKELLLPQIEFWCEQFAKKPNGPGERLLRYALREIWDRVVRDVPGFLDDRQAIDALVERYPQLIVTIGDQYAADKNFERALAIFGHAVSEQSGFDHVRRLLALADPVAGKDQWPLDDAARVKLRQRALDRLRAELTDMSRRLDADPKQDPQAMIQTLTIWEDDLDLERVREFESLARLNADERKAWGTFWSDVDSFEKRLPALQVTKSRGDEDNAAQLADIHRRAHMLVASNPKLAEPLFREALRGYRQIEGPGSELIIDLTMDLAGVLSQTGRAAEAEPYLRGALQSIEAMGGDDGHHYGISIMLNLGICLARQDKWTEAEPLFHKAIDGTRELYGDADPRMGGILATLGMELVEAGKYVEAEPYLRDCLAIREKQQPDEWNTFNSRSLLGGSLLGQKRYVEAEHHIIAGYEGMKSRENKIPPPAKDRLKEAAARVVKLYEAWDKPDKAAEWRRKLSPAKASPER